MRVSLLGTVHADSGLANAAELQAIIERLSPDVIFAEVPSASIDQYLDGSRGTIESAAVARYREGRELAVIPVDLPEPNAEFFRSAEEMFGKVERTSADYRRMVDRHSADMRSDGFPYLNSDRCIRAWCAIHNEVLATLDWIRQPYLREIYARWCNQNELRDTAMVTNIEEYGSRRSSSRGLLLVGSAHRKSVAEKARAERATSLRGVEWELDIPVELLEMRASPRGC